MLVRPILRRLGACLAVGCASSSAVAPVPPRQEAASAAAPSAPTEEVGHPVPPSPSSGCGHSSTASGVLQAHAGNLQTPYLLSLPDGYDGSKPVPLVFAFHGRTRSHLALHDTDASHLAELLGPSYAIAYVKSVGPGYDQPREQPDNLQLFDALYAHLLGNYCIDTEQVFALGHSSGALFSELLACERARLLRGIAAVAGALVQPECPGRSAALLIHGQHDKVVSVSRGRYARAHFLRANGCSNQSSAVGAPGCVQYAGCQPGLPVEWCEHDEATYEDTNHGWPSFASAEIARFFATLGRAPHAPGASLIQNGSFETGSEPWEISFAGKAKGTSSTQTGALCATLDSASQNAWDAQLLHSNLKLEQGREYIVDYRLWTSAPSDVRVRLGLAAAPFSEYWVKNVAATREPRRVIDHVVLAEPAVGSLALGFQFAGTYARTVPLTLCIDEVTLTPAADGAAPP
jgi:polyhydroxybutyrate depolymerase